ncbi:MAG: hypothetical protein J6X54_06740 [Treponema sp.]|nr:hypothetical protein [Treponema sp.]
MAQVTNYQCPACTGPLHFSSKTKKLECDYCGSSYEVSEIDAIYNKKVDAAKEESQKKKQENEIKWDATGIRSYNCPSCGAEIFCDINTVATSCPYCSNPSVIPNQFTAGRMPDLVIPFSVDKKQAINALTEHYNKKPLLPKVFKTENHIEEIKGIYVPFWLFGGSSNASVNLDCTNSSSARSGNTETITTKHYKVSRKGKILFQKIPVDASKKMDNALMDSIEPFNYSKLEKFSTSYLPGFYAEAYDDSEEDCKPRAQVRIESSSIGALLDTVGSYDTQSVTSKEVDIKYDDTAYALFPVWLLNTKWRDKNFLFGINGQTGKLAGDLPVSWGKFWAYFFAVLAGSGAVLTAICYFIMGYFK